MYVEQTTNCRRKERCTNDDGCVRVAPVMSGTYFFSVCEMRWLEETTVDGRHMDGSLHMIGTYLCGMATKDDRYCMYVCSPDTSYSITSTYVLNVQSQCIYLAFHPFATLYHSLVYKNKCNRGCWVHVSPSKRFILENEDAQDLWNSKSI